MGEPHRNVLAYLSAEQRVLGLRNDAAEPYWTPECIGSRLQETELQKGQRWLTSLPGTHHASSHLAGTHNVDRPTGVRRPDGHAQQWAFEQALHAVQSVQAATAMRPCPRGFETREGMLKAEERALQVRIEAQALTERRIAAEDAALLDRKNEAAIASDAAAQREQALNQREAGLDLRDSDIKMREDHATQREAAVHAREEAASNNDMRVGKEMQGREQQMVLAAPSRMDFTQSPPHPSPCMQPPPAGTRTVEHVGSRTVDHTWCVDLLSNQQLDQHLGDVFELIEYMDSVDDSESDRSSMLGADCSESDRSSMVGAD